MSSLSFPPLSQHIILEQLDKNTSTQLDELLIYDSIPSTNDVLWQQITQGKTQPIACLTELQTAGRGRRGDQWHSPDSGNIYLSLSWSFPAETAQNGLSLAIGISLINRLKCEGINGLKIKWPNDILYKKQKLAGILVESRFGKRLHIVIGIGLNFKLPTATQNKIQQPTTSLQQICTHIPCRNELAGKIIQTMITTLQQFETHGLHPFLPQWAEYDLLAEQEIVLIDGNNHTHVTAKGINELGELVYQHDNSLHTLSNSHISIRFAS